MIDESAIRERFEALAPLLDEQGRRRFAAAEAATAGYGGVSAVSRATGIARSTIDRGLAELRGGEHDFVIPELGRAVPYGVYDIADNVGWVSVGIDHDTAAFAANAIQTFRVVSITDRRPAGYVDRILNATVRQSRHRSRLHVRPRRGVERGRGVRRRRDCSAAQSRCQLLPVRNSKRYR